MENTNNKKFIKILSFYAIYSWFASFSSSVLPTHFLEQGIDYNQMIFGKFLVFGSPLILLLFLKNFRSKIAWRLAPICYLMFVLLSIRILGSTQFYIASVFAGFSLFFFYVFYNVAHFANTQKEKTGHSSALMFSVGPVINIVAPLASGYIASVSLTWLWILAILSFAVCLFFAEKQENFTVSYTIKGALREIKTTRLFILIEGVWGAVPFALIPIFTLYFIKEPLPYGAYLAYLSLVAVVANILFGKFTDKIQKRSIFLYPITIITALFTFLLYFAINDLYLWIIATSLLQFVLPLFWNLSTSLVIDAHTDLKLAIPAREIILSLGRMVGLLLACASLTVEKIPQNIFILLGIILLFYPTLLLWNTKVKKKYSYL